MAPRGDPGAGPHPGREAWAAARRPALVRTAVLLGSPPRLAAGLADRVLADRGVARAAARAAARGGHGEDPDRLLLARLLEERDADRTPWWHTDPPPVDGPLAALSTDLDRLAPGERAALVWAALVPGGDPPVDPALAARVAEVAAYVEVPEAGTAPRRRRARGPLVVVAALLAVGAAGSWWALREPAEVEPPLGPAEVRVADNPAPVAWYADGQVHLDGAVAAVAGVRALVEMGEGAVYLDGDGRVVRLEPDGERLLLGRADPAYGLVGSEVLGWAAWVAPGGSLDVVDVPAAALLARRDLPEGPPRPRLLSMRGTVLLHADADGLHEWDLSSGTYDTEPEADGPVVDVVGGTRVVQAQDDVLVAQRPYGEPLVRVGRDGRVSPRQQYLLARVGEGGTQVRAWSLVTGEEVRTGTTGADVVLDARFTAGDLVTYLLADRAAVPEAGEASRNSTAGPLEVRTCQLRTGRCTVDDVGAGRSDAVAVLAR